MSFKIIYTILFAGVLFACSNPNEKTVEYKVLGNCSMCKETIEGSLKDVTGVSKADWNVDSKKLMVVYDNSKIKEDEIYTKVSAAGYDSEKMKGSDEAYKNLHECCQYKRTITY